MTYTLAYTFTDAEYSDYFLSKSGENIQGNDVTKIPRHRLNIDLSMDVLKIDAGKLTWNLNFMAQDRYAMDNVNDNYYGGYGLLNSLLRWDAGSYDLFFSIQNILDKDYDGYASASSGKRYYYPAAGRTLTAGIALKF